MNSRLRGIDPTLYFITDTRLCERAGRTVPETVSAAVRGGAGIVQVRDKEMDDTSFYHLSLAVLEAVEKTSAGIGRHVPVVLNDRLDVVARLRGEGRAVHIHVGQDDIPVTEVRSRLGPEPLIGLSAAAEDEFAAARASACVDLLGIGPVFATSTKGDAGSALGVSRLAELAQHAGIPSVAIGGIDTARAGLLRNTGILGICVVSAICLAPHPEDTARALYHGFKGGKST